MSVTGFEQAYVASPGARQIYARPIGSIAASMMGVTALMALGLGYVVTNKAARSTQESVAVQAVTPPAAPATEAKQTSGFDLTLPEFAKEKKTRSSRTDASGREENLTLGQFAAQGPYLRLDLRTAGAEAKANQDFFLDLTRHAAGAGLAAIRIGQPSTLATRFGAFEAADIRLSLATPEGAGGERACVALRLPAGKAPLEITGFICGAGAKPFDRKSVGCMIDRLDYAADGADPALAEFFRTASDADRVKACGGSSAAAEKASWIEAHTRGVDPKVESLPPKHTKKAR